MSSTRPANHDRVEPAGDSAGQPLNRLFERYRILDVADRLFYERGIHAAGVDLIVAESGAAKTTLYSHFKTKDDLVAAYLERRCLLWRERLNAAVSGGDEPASQRLLRSCASSTFSATGSPNRTSAAARSSTPWRNSPPIIRPRR